MKLSKRLYSVTKMLNKSDNIVDVGADHGLIERYLLENDHQGKILAIDNKIGPFNRLKKALLNTKVELSLSDGLKEVSDDYDTAIFAGMGGLLIKEILTRDLKTHPNINKIIVDAHHDVEALRRFIVKQGFLIEKEDLVFEKGYYYYVISFKKGKAIYSDIEYEFGYQIKDHPNFIAYRNDTIKKLDELINNKEINETSKIKIIEKKERLLNL